MQENVLKHNGLALSFTTFSFSFAQVDYRLGFQVENTSAMDQPQSNISVQGEVPRTRSGVRFCFSSFTLLRFEWKMCY